MPLAQCVKDGVIYSDSCNAGNCEISACRCAIGGPVLARGCERKRRTGNASCRGRVLNASKHCSAGPVAGNDGPILLLTMS